MAGILERGCSRRTLLKAAAGVGGTLLLSQVTEREIEDLLSPPIIEAAELPSFPLPDGWHFTQTRGEAPYPYGYSIRGEIWKIYLQTGGEAVWGPVISREYRDKIGRVCQASQRGVFQLTLDRSGDLLKVEWLNIVDELTKIPNFRHPWIPKPLTWESDRGKSWEGIIENHVERVFSRVPDYPQLKDSYLAIPSRIERYGLPMGAEDFGPVVVLNCQRAILQLWKEKTEWTNKPGEIILALTGDLAKENGLLPKEALEPQNPFLGKENLLVPEGFSSINELRVLNGRTPLVHDPSLEAVAQKRVEQTIEHVRRGGEFDETINGPHFTPKGRLAVYAAVEELGELKFGKIYSEILGRTNGLWTPVETQRGWIMTKFAQSEKHMATILQPGFNFLGMADAVDGEYRYLAGALSS